MCPLLREGSGGRRAFLHRIPMLPHLSLCVPRKIFASSKPTAIGSPCHLSCFHPSITPTELSSPCDWTRCGFCPSYTPTWHPLILWRLHWNFFRFLPPSTRLQRVCCLHLGVGQLCNILHPIVNTFPFITGTLVHEEVVAVMSPGNPWQGIVREGRVGRGSAPVLQDGALSAWKFFGYSKDVRM